MIPDFKTFIRESAWGDMMRRGSGESIRTEDDVNLLDVDELTAYLRKNYRIDDPLTITRLIGNGGCIYVSLYEDTDGYDYILMYEHIDNGDKKLYLSGGVKEVSEDIFNEMKNKYKVTVLNDYDPDGHPLGNIMVEPNDGRNITNKFFLEVLDFIIERIEKPLTQKIYKKSMNESAWGDMMRRGSGEEIRKEDEFNDICEFIKNTYYVVFVGMDDIEFKDDYIHIPIYKVVGLNAFSSVDIYKNEITFSSIDPNKYHTQTLRKFITYIKDDLNQMFDKIKDTYSPEISTFDGLEHWIEFEIVPKDGKITKQFCEEVIDFVLNNITDDNNKILKILEKI